LELKKLPVTDDGTELYDWAKFIAAENEEELDMVAERNPEVKKAVVTLRKLSTDEHARDMYERREKARRDKYAHESDLREEGRVEGRAEGETSKAYSIASNLLSINMPVDTIISVTGLNREQIESLRKST